MFLITSTFEVKLGDTTKAWARRAVPLPQRSDSSFQKKGKYNVHYISAAFQGGGSLGINPLIGTIRVPPIYVVGKPTRTLLLKNRSLGQPNASDHVTVLIQDPS